MGTKKSRSNSDNFEFCCPIELWDHASPRRSAIKSVLRALGHICKMKQRDIKRDIKCGTSREPSIPGNKHGDFCTIIAHEETDHVLNEVKYRRNA